MKWLQPNSNYAVRPDIDNCNWKKLQQNFRNLNATEYNKFLCFIALLEFHKYSWLLLLNFYLNMAHIFSTVNEENSYQFVPSLCILLENKEITGNTNNFNHKENKLRT